MGKMKEEWKIISDYPKYAVSNMGRVKRVAQGKGSKNGYILKPIRHPQGYLVVALSDDPKNGQQKILIHRLVAKEFVTNPMSYVEVNHINGIKTDNIFSNLEWVDHQDNVIHCLNTGLNKKCLKVGEVWLIRKMISNGFDRELISKMFLVSKQVISYIARGRTHKRIADENFRPKKRNVTVLTEDVVASIRKHLASGEMMQRDIAMKFNIHESTVSMIKHKRSYKYENSSI